MARALVRRIDGVLFALGALVIVGASIATPSEKLGEVLGFIGALLIVAALFVLAVRHGRDGSGGPPRAGDGGFWGGGPPSGGGHHHGGGFAGHGDGPC